MKLNNISKYNYCFFCSQFISGILFGIVSIKITILLQVTFMLKSKLLATLGFISLACLSSIAHTEFIETDLLVEGDALSTLIPA